MDPMLVLAKKEFITGVKRKAYIMFTLFYPIFIVGMPIVTGGLFVNMAPQTRLGILDNDQSPGSMDFIAYLYGSSTDYNISMLEDEEGMLFLLNETKLDGAVVIPDGFGEELAGFNASVLLKLSSSMNTPQLERRIRSAVSTYALNLTSAYLKEMGISENVLNPVELEVEMEGDEMFIMSMLSMLFPMLIVVSMFMGGTFISEGVAEEKETKTIEILVSAPLSYPGVLLGKIMGYGLLVILQLTIWTMVMNLIMGGSVLGVLELLLASLPAILFFTSLGVGVSALTKNFKEARSYYGMFILPGIFVMMFPLNGMLKTVLLYFPFTSSLTSVKLITEGSMSLLSIAGLLSFVSGLLGSALIVFLCAKIFEKRILG